MSWQPAIPLNLLIPFAAILVAITGWLNWRSVILLGRKKQSVLLALRFAGLGLLILFFLNPGRWVAPVQEGLSQWLVLLDHSASMSVNDGGEGSQTRWKAACSLAFTLQSMQENGKAGTLKWRRFAGELDANAGDSAFDPDSVPDGGGTDITAALSSSLAGFGEDELAGVVVLSDGRQTKQETPLQEAVLRARARKLPIHTVVFGGEVARVDLSVQVIRRQILAFPGQEITLGAEVSAQGLGDVRVPVRWLDGEGNELQSDTLELKDGEPANISCKTAAPETTASYTVELPRWDGDQREGNNRETVRVRILSGKTRVFLAEGAPYWDSKFLAQLFRQQPFIDLLSIHRLSDTRYFRIDSSSAEPAVSSDAIFPATAAEMSAFDLLVFGKGIETFLNAERIATISEYVRNQGGAVLFARGRGYAGRLPALEPLEPVTWTETTIDSFQLRPAEEGETAGLFGEALPARGDPVWAKLPTLQDARRVDTIKPFTRVLAHGTASALRSTANAPASDGNDEGFPLLMVRRYGLGVVGVVNADGLWKWDFFPEAKESGNMYVEFWAQLIQWMASYSEFLPGQAYALRLSSTRLRAGEIVYATVGWRPLARGDTPPATPVIHITDAVTGASIRRFSPANLPGEDDRLRWRIGIETDRAAEWLLRLENAGGKILNGPEASLTVQPAPGERENVDADPRFLEDLAAATGGRLWTPDEATKELSKHLIAPPTRLTGAARWDPLWARWQLLLVAASVFALEWWLRRRAGIV